MLCYFRWLFNNVKECPGLRRQQSRVPVAFFPSWGATADEWSGVEHTRIVTARELYCIALIMLFLHFRTSKWVGRVAPGPGSDRRSWCRQTLRRDLGLVREFGTWVCPDPRPLRSWLLSVPARVLAVALRLRRRRSALCCCSRRRGHRAHDYRRTQERRSPSATGTGSFTRYLRRT
jgi:hypothetical protein